MRPSIWLVIVNQPIDFRNFKLLVPAHSYQYILPYFISYSSSCISSWGCSFRYQLYCILKMAVKRVSNLENIPENIEASMKRVPPPFIQQLLAYDAELTQYFNNFLVQKLPVTFTKSETKFMEVKFSLLNCLHLWWVYSFQISGSGFIWIPLCVVMFILDGTFTRQSALNLLLGLLTDIIIVALLKAFARRKRPPTKKEDYFQSVGPDVYSFPSGHASRSVLLAIMYTQFSPLFEEWILFMLTFVFIWIWSISVCLSRLINGRHYLLDVVAGVLVGFAESYIVQYLWRSQEQANSFFNYFSEDEFWFHCYSKS